MSIFKNFASMLSRENAGTNQLQTINVNDLRIVKVYINHKKEVDANGNVIGMGNAKASSKFVLVEKKEGYYLTIPVSENEEPKVLFTKSNKLYDFFIKKTSSNNRYRKPNHLCTELDGKLITLSQATTFASIIRKIDSDTSLINAKNQEERLKNACRTFNNIVNKKTQNINEQTM